MYILSLVLLVGMLSGCAQMAMSLAISGIETGLMGLENSFIPKPKKISEEQLSRLKPGMTKQEVGEILQKSPLMTTTMSDGGSVATYVYNTTDGQSRSEHMTGIFGLMGVFNKADRESQSLMISFDRAGKYVMHTFEETKVCGSQATGYNADNCERKTAGVN